MLLLPYIVSSVAVNKLTVMYNALYYYPVENGALPIWILWTEAHEKKNAPFHCLHVLPLIHTSVCASCSILALSSSHIHAHTLVLTHSLSDPPLRLAMWMARRCTVTPLSQFFLACPPVIFLFILQHDVFQYFYCQVCKRNSKFGSKPCNCFKKHGDKIYPYTKDIPLASKLWELHLRTSLSQKSMHTCFTELQWKLRFQWDHTADWIKRDRKKNIYTQ